MPVGAGPAKQRGQAQAGLHLWEVTGRSHCRTVVLPQCHRERIVGRKPLIRKGLGVLDSYQILAARPHGT